MISRAATESGQLDFTGGVLTDDYLVRLFKAAKGIKTFLDDVAEHLEARMLAGASIPGLKLVLGREGNRAWTDEDAADKLLAQSGKLKMEQRYKMSLIPPTQAETLDPLRQLLQEPRGPQPRPPGARPRVRQAARHLLAGR
jgi:hypothetical protein